MNTLTVIIMITAVVLLIVLIAYVSVLLSDRNYYKLLADRWEEAYFENSLATEKGAGETNDIMNGIDKKHQNDTSNRF